MKIHDPENHPERSDAETRADASPLDFEPTEGFGSNIKDLNSNPGTHSEYDPGHTSGTDSEDGSQEENASFEASDSSLPSTGEKDKEKDKDKEKGIEVEQELEPASESAALPEIAERLPAESRPQSEQSEETAEHERFEQNSEKYDPGHTFFTVVSAVTTVTADSFDPFEAFEPFEPSDAPETESPSQTQDSAHDSVTSSLDFEPNAGDEGFNASHVIDPSNEDDSSLPMTPMTTMTGEAGVVAGAGVVAEKKFEKTDKTEKTEKPEKAMLASESAEDALVVKGFKGFESFEGSEDFEGKCDPGHTFKFRGIEGFESSSPSPVNSSLSTFSTSTSTSTSASVSDSAALDFEPNASAQNCSSVPCGKPSIPCSSCFSCSSGKNYDPGHTSAAENSVPRASSPVMEGRIETIESIKPVQSNEKKALPSTEVVRLELNPKSNHEEAEYDLGHTSDPYVCSSPPSLSSPSSSISLSLSGKCVSDSAEFGLLDFEPNYPDEPAESSSSSSSSSPASENYDPGHTFSSEHAGNQTSSPVMGGRNASNQRTISETGSSPEASKSGHQLNPGPNRAAPRMVEVGGGAEAGINQSGPEYDPGHTFYAPESASPSLPPNFSSYGKSVSDPAALDFEPNDTDKSAESSFSGVAIATASFEKYDLGHTSSGAPAVDSSSSPVMGRRNESIQRTINGTGSSPEASKSVNTLNPESNCASARSGGHSVPEYDPGHTLYVPESASPSLSIHSSSFGKSVSYSGALDFEPNNFGTHWKGCVLHLSSNPSGPISSEDFASILPMTGGNEGRKENEEREESHVYDRALDSGRDRDEKEEKEEKDKNASCEEKYDLGHTSAGLGSSSPITGEVRNALTERSGKTEKTSSGLGLGPGPESESESESDFAHAQPQKRKKHQTHQNYDPGHTSGRGFGGNRAPASESGSNLNLNLNHNHNHNHNVPYESLTDSALGKTAATSPAIAPVQTQTQIQTQTQTSGQAQVQARAQVVKDRKDRKDRKDDPGHTSQPSNHSISTPAPGSECGSVPVRASSIPSSPVMGKDRNECIQRNTSTRSADAGAGVEDASGVAAAVRASKVKGSVRDHAHVQAHVNAQSQSQGKKYDPGHTFDDRAASSPVMDVGGIECLRRNEKDVIICKGSNGSQKARTDLPCHLYRSCLPSHESEYEYDPGHTPKDSLSIPHDREGRERRDGRERKGVRSLTTASTNTTAATAATAAETSNASTAFNAFNASTFSPSSATFSSSAGVRPRILIPALPAGKSESEARVVRTQRPLTSEKYDPGHSHGHNYAQNSGHNYVHARDKFAGASSSSSYFPSSPSPVIGKKEEGIYGVKGAKERPASEKRGTTKCAGSTSSSKRRRSMSAKEAFVEDLLRRLHAEMLEGKGDLIPDGVTTEFSARSADLAQFERELKLSGMEGLDLSFVTLIADRMRKQNKNPLEPALLINTAAKYLTIVCWYCIIDK